ncbi:MAG: hypothetical protein P8Y44_04345, partial [Acidobacteriota bacterium]
MTMGTDRSRRKRKIAWSAMLAGVLLALAGLFTGWEGVAGETLWVSNLEASSPRIAALATGDATEVATWGEIDRLIEQQQFRAAEGKVERRLEAAMARGDDADWARSLIRLVQLQTALHGYETA